jgi:hypothetical protein
MRKARDNLPAAVVEKWSGMRLDDSRRLLREVGLARPALAGGEALDASFILDLPEPRP